RHAVRARRNRRTVHEHAILSRSHLLARSHASTDVVVHRNSQESAPPLHHPELACGEVWGRANHDRPPTAGPHWKTPNRSAHARLQPTLKCRGQSSGIAAAHG